MSRVETIGNATLHLGDCRDVLPTIGRIDAIVTDPPYGIGINKSDRLSVSRGHGGENWDDEAADISWLLPMGLPAIVWGGNYFPLPPTRAPLVWDKNNAGRDFADFELAWTNLDMVARRIIFRPMNMDGGKLHPTQKPVEVMRWCISHLPVNTNVILDPYMGSGTTGVAAIDLGRSFVGVEREPRYFEIALKRIDAAFRAPRLFAEPDQRRTEQVGLFS